MATTIPSVECGENSDAKILQKCPTGIRGLDEITLGGLPRSCPTLVCGGPGCGKTLLAMEFLIRGATQFGEPGVCVSFEESGEELARNLASLGLDLSPMGCDLDGLVEDHKLSVDYVIIERNQFEEAGEYDLEALFARLAYAVDSIRAKRIVLDSPDSLFAGLTDERVLRSELHRLFRWLKDRKLTAVITAEKGDSTLTRHGLEEYVSDCVILLGNRVTETVFTRNLRVVKYRGSTHGTDEYPFLIDSGGISALPVTSLELNHPATNERVSTGIPALDALLGGQGYYRGNSVVISGTSGTGKTSIAAQFVDAACARGEACLFLSFEESEQQVVRNMRSIGIDLAPWIQRGLLQFRAARPTTFGLEMHLVKIYNLVHEFRPEIVVVDPATAFLNASTVHATWGMLLRMIDFFKSRQITAVMTTLTSPFDPAENSEVNISSLVDTWLLLREIESSGERDRVLCVLKARGMAHSNQIREFLLTDRGIQLREVYLGSAGVLTGSARLAQEARDASEALLLQQEIDREELLHQRRRKALEARTAALELARETEEQQYNQAIAQRELRLKRSQGERDAMAKSRSAYMRAGGEPGAEERR